MVTRMLIGPDVTRTFIPADGAAGVDFHNFPDRLGSVRWNAQGSKAYRLVMCVELALVVGDLTCFTSLNDMKTVSSDRDGATAENELAAGLVVTACAVGSACWIQVAGLSDAAIVTDGNVSEGDALIAEEATDGGAETSDVTANIPGAVFGVALDDDTGTALAAGLVDLKCSTVSAA